MILAQVAGSSVGAYVLIDVEMPHWAVHHGRQRLRRVAEEATAAWRAGKSWGWMRVSAPFQTAVREYGSAKLNVWPVDRSGLPRDWTGRDTSWRWVINDLFLPELNRICDARAEFMPGSGPVIRSTTDRLLQSVPVFIAGKPRFRRQAPSRRLLVA